MRPIQDLHSPRGRLRGSLRWRSQGCEFKEAMAEVQEGRTADVTGDGGRRRASSAISGSVRFRLCRPKVLSMLNFTSIIRSRTSRGFSYRINASLSPKIPVKRKTRLILVHAMHSRGRDLDRSSVRRRFTVHRALSLSRLEHLQVFPGMPAVCSQQPPFLIVGAYGPHSYASLVPHTDHHSLGINRVVARSFVINY